MTRWSNAVQKTVKRPHHSKRKMTYHGRSGHPVIHYTTTGKQYIMVRKRGGGNKRLYLKKKEK